MVDPAGDNKRRYERVEATVEVSLQSEHNFYTGFTRDISEGGVFVAGLAIQPIGTPIELELKLGKGTIVVQGVVRWVREPSRFTQDVPPGMGVEFTDIPEVVRDRINEFVTSFRESIFFDE